MSNLTILHARTETARMLTSYFLFPHAGRHARRIAVSDERPPGPQTEAARFVPVARPVAQLPPRISLASERAARQCAATRCHSQFLRVARSRFRLADTWPAMFSRRGPLLCPTQARLSSWFGTSLQPDRGHKLLQILLGFFLKYIRPMKACLFVRIVQSGFYLFDQSFLVAVVVGVHAASFSGSRGHHGNSAPQRFHAREAITLQTESSDENVAALQKL